MERQGKVRLPSCKLVITVSTDLLSLRFSLSSVADTVDIEDHVGFMEDDDEDEEGSFADTEGSSAGGEDDSEDEWNVALD